MDERPSTDDVAGSTEEMASLVRFLGFQRGTILRKAEGVGRDDGVRPMVPSGTSLLGIVKHLTHVERFWFQEVFAGRDVDFPWTDDDPDADWRVEDGEDAAAILDGYRRAVAESEACIEGAAPDDRCRSEAHDFTLRWILLHMIEETARHAGHADLIREQLDGSTGF